MCTPCVGCCDVASYVPYAEGICANVGGAIRPYRAVVEEPTVAPKASAGALRGAWGYGDSPLASVTP